MKLHKFLLKPRNLEVVDPLLPKVFKKKLVWPVMVRSVQGHSMMPILPPNTLVVGLRYFRRLNPDDVIIFVHEGREKIKRIREIRKNELFVVGDHAEASIDSRHYGWIGIHGVVAKVIRPHDLKPEALND